MKTERKQVHFLSNVFAAVASSDLEVPNYVSWANLVPRFPTERERVGERI